MKDDYKNYQNKILIWKIFSTKRFKWFCHFTFFLINPESNINLFNTSLPTPLKKMLIRIKSKSKIGPNIFWRTKSINIQKKWIRVHVNKCSIFHRWFSIHIFIYVVKWRFWSFISMHFSCIFFLKNIFLLKICLFKKSIIYVLFFFRWSRLIDYHFSSYKRESFFSKLYIYIIFYHSVLLIPF